MKLDFNRIIFINVGVMDKYQGLKSDSIRRGGSWVKERGFGAEIFNFRPFKGRMYGYGRSPQNRFAIERFGARASDQYVDDVLVIWVADSHVVGWYRNARLFRSYQDPPSGSARTYKGESLGYVATAQKSHCCLIDDRDARTLHVPRAREVKGGMGRYIWYPEPSKHKKFFKALKALIESGGKIQPKAKKTGNAGGKGWQLDAKTRHEIEDAAIQATWRRYQTDFGYDVKDRQRDHVGWDLEATRNGSKLLLEVKGCSGGIGAELSSNEYKALKKHKDQYRICVLMDALTKQPHLSIFRWVPEDGCWRDQNRRKLIVEERKAARLSV